MKDLDRISAEVRAHAAQLTQFCREQGLGFCVAIFDGEHVLRASNAAGETLKRVLSEFDATPIASERVKPGAAS